MDSADKVIKFPDGKGGFILKRRDSSGAWVPLEDSTSEKEVPVRSQTAKTPAVTPLKKKRRAKSSPTEDIPAKCIGVRLPPELEEDLDDFIRWKSFTSRENVSKSSAVQEAIECLFKKYPDFREYRKKR